MDYSDLHLHLEGSLSIDDIRILSWLDREADSDLPYEDEEIMKLLTMEVPQSTSRNSLDYVLSGVASPSSKGVGNYNKCFNLPISLLQTEENLSYAIDELAKRLKKKGVSYAEVRFAPQLHTKRGLTQMAVVEAVLNGYTRRLDFTGEEKHSPTRLKLMRYENATGINLGLDEEAEYPHIRFILSLMRGNMRDPKLYEMNMETVEIARHYMSENNFLIAGLDLAGTDGIYPLDDYIDFFGMARKYRIPFTMHACDSVGTDSIWDALRFEAKRIGHGISVVEDGRLMSELAERGTVLELCPTRDLKTGAVESLDRYPIRLLMQYGIKVTINSDSMTILGTDVVNEFETLKHKLLLTTDEEMKLLKNAEDGRL